MNIRAREHGGRLRLRSSSVPVRKKKNIQPILSETYSEISVKKEIKVQTSITQGNVDHQVTQENVMGKYCNFVAFFIVILCLAD